MPPAGETHDRSLVTLHHVTKSYALEDGTTVVALDDVSLGIGDKQFVSLIGPSGCGKSTMMSIVAGLLAPSSGEILIAGHPPERAQAARELGIVFQQPVLLPWRTIRANCRLLLEVTGALDADAERRIDDLLGLVGLTEFSERYPSQLSGGMRQRAAIARALCLDPVLLLMDEPFAALDEFTRHQMNLELLEIQARSRKTVMFVTHNIAEAVFLSDRVVAMSPRPGRIIEDIEIDLPRPRDSRIRYSRDFTDYVVRLQILLEQPAYGSA